MPSWTWVLAKPDGSTLAELHNASGKRINYKRNGVPEARCILSHEDDAAQRLWDTLTLTGIPRLYAYRDKVLRFAGYLAPFSESLEEDTQLELVFRGPFGRLQGDGDGSGRFTAEIVDLFADAGEIAWSLINSANTDGETGIKRGNVEATKQRERTYEFANVGDAIVDLTDLFDGFDFEVLPINEGAKIGEFHVYARQGGAKEKAVFQYGPDTIANTRNVQRNVRPPVNAVRLLGREGDVAEVTHAGSIATYGKWWRQESATDVEDFDVLLDKARGLLRPNPIRTIEFTPELSLSPRPIDDFWLGDTVSFYGARGAFTESVKVRVNEIGIVIDEDGNESAEMSDPIDPDEERTMRSLLAVEVI